LRVWDLGFRAEGGGWERERTEHRYMQHSTRHTVQRVRMESRGRSFDEEGVCVLADDERECRGVCVCIGSGLGVASLVLQKS